MNWKPPKYELKKIMNTGEQEGETMIYPLLSLPANVKTDRRGFLGAGIATTAALGLLAGCSREEEITSGQTVNVTRTKKTAQSEAMASDSCLMDGPDLYERFASNHLENAVFSPDNQTVAIWSNNFAKYQYLTLWEVPSGKLLHRLKHEDEFSSTIYASAIVFSPSGDRVYCSAASTMKYVLDGKKHFDQNRIFNWDTKTGKELEPIELDYKHDDVDILLFSPNGKLLTIAANSGYTNGSQIYTLDVESKKLREVGDRRKHNEINAMCFNHDGSRLITGSNYGVVRILEMPDGRLIKSLKETKKILSMAKHPLQEIIVTGDEDGIIMLWEIETGKLLNIIGTDQKHITQLCFTPDGTLISSGNSVKFWDLDTFAVTHFIKPDGHSVKKYGQLNAYISNNGQYLLTAENHTAKLWNLNNDTFLTCLHDKEVIRSGGSSPPSRGTYCSCNKVCSCVPVCQAHEVLNPNPIIAHIAEQLLCYMGKDQFPYMRWAANESSTSVRKHINKVIYEIKKGRKADFNTWPELHQIKPLLEHENKIVCIMAAQMIHIKASIQGVPIKESKKSKISRLLSIAKHRNLSIQHKFRYM